MPLLNVPPFVAATNEKPLGPASVIVTLVAYELPALAYEIVKVAGLPGAT